MNSLIDDKQPRARSKKGRKQKTPANKPNFEGTYQGERVTVKDRFDKVTKNNVSGVLASIYIGSKYITGVPIKTDIEADKEKFRAVAVDLATKWVEGKYKDIDDLKKARNLAMIDLQKT